MQMSILCIVVIVTVAKLCINIMLETLVSSLEQLSHLMFYKICFSCFKEIQEKVVTCCYDNRLLCRKLFSIAT